MNSYEIILIYAQFDVFCGKVSKINTSSCLKIIFAYVRICENIYPGESMIVDGNYIFLDFEKVKQSFENVYAEYFGEEFRQEIKEKLDRVEYFGFHDYKEVVDYYNGHLEKYRDEVIDEFFKVLKIPYSEDLAKILFPDGKDIMLNTINVACEGGEKIEESYTDNAKKDIRYSRDLLGELFSISPENLYEEICNLRKSLNVAISNIENKHKCNVFSDCENIMSTKRKVFQKFLHELGELGVNISSRDNLAVSSENFDDNSIYNLECFGTFFNSEFLDSGGVEAFVQDEEDVCGFESEYIFLYNRLRFLEYSGVELKYIEELDDLEDNRESLELLRKEYKYQKNNFIELDSIACVDKAAWKKDWKKGNFLPRHIAESIEYIRNECQDELYLKCKNFDFYKQNKFQLGCDYFTTYNFDVSDGMKPYYRVYINEGLADNEYTLSALIHELIHVLGFYPISLKNGEISCKEGLSMIAFKYLSKVEEEKERWDWEYDDDEALAILHENILQRMAKEVMEMYLKMYPNPYVSDQSKTQSTCEYEFYDFITEDFYRANKKLLQKNIMSKSLHNLYYDSDGYYEKKGPLGSLVRYISNGIARRQDENRKKFSVGDLRKIGELIGYFEKEVLYFISSKGVTQEQIKNGEYKKILSPGDSHRLEEILKERDKLNKMLVDEKGKCGSILQK